jgi:Ser/Thr protein kinase RdoA (MazF antagonist)
MKQIQLDKPLARGRTADVFEWDDGTILKLFHDWFEIENIEYEFEMAQAVYVSGVNSPQVKELVKVEGRNGLVYERVFGRPMEDVLLFQPWKVLEYAHILARLHAQMHECVFDENKPAQRGRLEGKINRAGALPAALKEALLKELQSLPEGDRVCHGDFHPANVLLTQAGATVIDWIDSSRGNPLADVARTTIILRGAAATSTNPILRYLIKTAHASYLQEYFRLRPNETKEEYNHWLPIVAAARLSERIPQLEEWLIREAEKIQRD